MFVICKLDVKETVILCLTRQLLDRKAVTRGAGSIGLIIVFIFLQLREGGRVISDCYIVVCAPTRYLSK